MFSSSLDIIFHDKTILAIAIFGVHTTFGPSRLFTREFFGPVDWSKMQSKAMPFPRLGCQISQLFLTFPLFKTYVFQSVNQLKQMIPWHQNRHLWHLVPRTFIPMEISMIELPAVHEWQRRMPCHSARPRDRELFLGHWWSLVRNEKNIVSWEF